MNLALWTIHRLAVLLATGPEPSEAEVRAIVAWLGSTGREVAR